MVPDDEGIFKGRGTAWKVSKAFGLALTEVGLFDVAEGVTVEGTGLDSKVVDVLSLE